MRATAAPVEDHRVRLSVEVDESEVERALEATARRLARQVRVPGFRPGKAPRRVLEARLGGPGALREEALRDVLPEMFARAVRETEIDPIAPPEIDIVAGEDSGAVKFEALVEVRPLVAIPGYGGLVVTVPPLAVSDQDVEAQLDRLRGQSGELVEVDRAARMGDWLTIDLHGSAQGSDIAGGNENVDVEDFLYELGSGSDLPGLDERLEGARPGDVIDVPLSSPDDEGVAGPVAVGSEPVTGAYVRVLVKDVKQKVLPEPTDEWASEASEFSSIDDLREDVRKRMRELRMLEARMALRDGALDALVGLVAEDVPEALVDREVDERLHDLGHQLQARQVSFEQYLQAVGADEASWLAQVREQALTSVKIDLGLRALADAEAIEVDDAELDQALAELAEGSGLSAAELRRRLDAEGRLPAVRSERRKAKALAWLLDNVDLVDEEGAPVPREELGVGRGSTSAAENSPEDVPNQDVPNQDVPNQGSVDVPDSRDEGVGAGS